MSTPHHNPYTREVWRGDDDRSKAPDYVARQLYPFRLIGRINGHVTEDQDALQSMREDILAQFED